jgi:predicted membrane-bound spermidine synthase
MSIAEQRRIELLSLLFFCSGFAALIYQVAWQRLLFLAFGVDTTSVTLIVSAFMLGLGVGALAGGWWVDRTLPSRALTGFVGAEIGVGLFGLISPWLLTAIGAWGAYWSPAAVGLTSFLILLVPTALMGATLPILVTYVCHKWRHVGAATGVLYAANTLGGAMGAVMAATYFFVYVPLDQIIYLSAGVNFLVAGGTWYWLSRQTQGASK